nr:twin-arginine translocation signal domain-containing protein [Segetibacter sp.]
MQNNRRKFLKLAGLTGLGAAGGGMLKGFAADRDDHKKLNGKILNTATVENNELNEKDISIIGLY